MTEKLFTGTLNHNQNKTNKNLFKIWFIFLSGFVRLLLFFYMCKGFADLKSSNFFENSPVQIKWKFYQGDLHMPILLYEQFIHHTQTNLCPNMQFLNTQQRIYQLFGVTSWFDSVCVVATRWVNLRKNNLKIKCKYKIKSLFFNLHNVMKTVVVAKIQFFNS